MKVFIFWVISLLTLLFWFFAVVDIVLTLGGNATYLKDFPPQMIVWIQGFPLWRKVLWAVTVLLGNGGAVLLLMRRPVAPALLWGAAILMLLAFIGYDLLLAKGSEYYGQTGLLASSFMIALAFLLALYASAALKGRYFKT
jgi:hypothetical protein